jgi:hypothetical protein
VSIQKSFNHYLNSHFVIQPIILKIEPWNLNCFIAVRNDKFVL